MLAAEFGWEPRVSTVVRGAVGGVVTGGVVCDAVGGVVGGVVER